MSDVADLVGGATRTPRSLTARGRVIIAPSSVTGTVVVTLPNYSTLRGFEIPGGQWMPRGSSLPNKGDECVVIFDDEGDAWMPAWRDQYGFS